MKIFVISLKRSVQRQAYIQEQLEAFNIPFEFFDAVDGRVEPPHPLFDNYNYSKRLWLTSGRMPSKGELGCYASHYLLWKKCVDLNEPILILEDDCKIKTTLKDNFDLIDQKVTEYDFLRLEPETEKGYQVTVESNEQYSISFMTNNFGGARAYALSPKGASKLLAKSERWCMPVDNYMGSIYIHSLPSYLFKPSIVPSIQEVPEIFHTTIQLGEEKKAPLYRKPTRELYSLYRKCMMKQYNKRFIRSSLPSQ